MIENFENNVTIKTDEQTYIDGLIRKKDAFTILVESPRENFEKKSKFKADKRKNWLRK